MHTKISNLDTSDNLITKLGDHIAKLISVADKNNKRFSWLLSGGRTPELLFDYMNQYWSGRLNWQLVDVFWVDERCVDIHSKDSNYGQAYRKLFQYCNGVTLYPMFVGGNLNNATYKYQKEVCNYIDKWSAFDLTLLGIGEDGHFASLFCKEDFISAKLVLINSSERHPHKRMTMNMPLILNSKSIVVLAIGQAKGIAFKEKKGIIDSLPMCCEFWVDSEFLKVLKNKRSEELNEDK